MPFVSGRPTARWLAVALWVAVIYGTVPFVRKLREAFAQRWPPELIVVAVMALIGLAAAAAVVAILRGPRRFRGADVLWLAAVTGALVIWSGSLMDRPEEAVHFVQYGILGVLLHRALRTRIDDPSVFVAAALIGTLVGTCDEILQWLVPERFFDLRDVVLNGGASALIQVALWRLCPTPVRRLPTDSLRRLCRLAAAEVAILVLCLAATPQRLGSLGRWLPASRTLARGSDVMAEYGHLHRLDDRTRFRSRLSLDELAAADGRLRRELAARDDLSRAGARELLRCAVPAVDPFAYELRIRLFSRDRSLAEARRAREGSEESRRQLTAAFREQLILEFAFAGSLAASDLDWKPRRRAQAEAGSDPSASYTSPVARHLITRVGEGELRILMLSLLGVLLACDLLLGRLRPAPRPPEG